MGSDKSAKETGAVAGGMEARGRLRCRSTLRTAAERARAPDLVPADPIAAAASAAASAERRALARRRALEVEDTPRVLRQKCRVLVQAIKEAKHLIVYTGAGISTAADIPDYRGPGGVWTRLRRGERVERVEVARAEPTFTHMALRALWAEGRVRFVVSQNCDGLHLRSGLPRRALAELHGNAFVERCARCRRCVLRDFDTTERTARHRHGTRRLCPAPGCGAELRDSIVHFGERGRAAWPLNWAGALRHASAADAVLCLGSSLKVLRRYPRLWRMAHAPQHRPRLYIVNLQWTPKDDVAALKINARCDDVMREVARAMRLRVPRYSPKRDPLLAHATPLVPREAHTARRPRLLPAPNRQGLSSDDDDEPLLALKRRLRATPPLPPSPPHAAPALETFQVQLSSGAATILLRTSPPAPPRPHPVFPAPSPLRLYRRPRPANPAVKVESGEWEEPKPKALLALNGDCKPKLEVKNEKDSDEASEDEEEEVAAGAVRRALAECRARLYPGLHTILGDGGGEGGGEGGVGSECAWCWRLRGARRCQWYERRSGGPRALRKGGRRYWCLCCPSSRLTLAPDTGGWYGKGYRKGRRRAHSRHL